jgi:hypothetical protein
MYPPGMVPGYPPRTSGAAITSLVCGLLLCVPALSGLLAIIFGIVGMSATRNPMVRGRGMAIAGLILGILNFLMWAGGTEVWWKNTAPERAAATQFINDLAAGNATAAAAECTDKVTADQLKTAMDWFTQQGPVQKIVAIGFANQNANNPMNPAGAAGAITFTSGQKHKFSIQFTNDQGTLKVDGFTFQ